MVRLYVNGQSSVDDVKLQCTTDLSQDPAMFSFHFTAPNGAKLSVHSPQCANVVSVGEYNIMMVLEFLPTSELEMFGINTDDTEKTELVMQLLEEELGCLGFCSEATSLMYHAQLPNNKFLWHKGYYMDEGNLKWARNFSSPRSKAFIGGLKVETWSLTPFDGNFCKCSIPPVRGGDPPSERVFTLSDLQSCEIYGNEDMHFIAFPLEETKFVKNSPEMSILNRMIGSFNQCQRSFIVHDLGHEEFKTLKTIVQSLFATVEHPVIQVDHPHKYGLYYRVPFFRIVELSPTMSSHFTRSTGGELMMRFPGPSKHDEKLRLVGMCNGREIELSKDVRYDAATGAMTYQTQFRNDNQVFEDYLYGAHTTLLATPPILAIRYERIVYNVSEAVTNKLEKLSQTPKPDDSSDAKPDPASITRKRSAIGGSGGYTVRKRSLAEVRIPSGFEKAQDSGSAVEEIIEMDDQQHEEPEKKDKKSRVKTVKSEIVRRAGALSQRVFGRGRAQAEHSEDQWEEEATPTHTNPSVFKRGPLRKTLNGAARGRVTSALRRSLRFLPGQRVSRADDSTATIEK